jgi:uncharacterized iron-regulated protein
MIPRAYDFAIPCLWDDARMMPSTRTTCPRPPAGNAVAIPVAGGVILSLALWLSAIPFAAAGAWIDDRGSSVSRAAVIERLERAEIVLLGEVHDSPEVHAEQLALLRSLGEHPLVLAMEQLDLEHREALRRLDGKPVTGRDIAAAGGFNEAGWGWEHYGALFSLAARQGWPVRPINLSRERAREIVHSDADWRLALTPEQVTVIESTAPELRLPADSQAALVRDLMRVHCGDMKPAFARRIARAQVARDLLMADAVLAARGEFPGRTVVAIMGNQHARRDRGAGYWIERMAADARSPGRMISMGMLPAGTAARERLREQGGEPYDLIRFVDPEADPPPCPSD